MKSISWLATCERASLQRGAHAGEAQRAQGSFQFSDRHGHRDPPVGCVWEWRFPERLVLGDGAELRAGLGECERRLRRRRDLALQGALEPRRRRRTAPRADARTPLRCRRAGSGAAGWRGRRSPAARATEAGEQLAGERGGVRADLLDPARAGARVSREGLNRRSALSITKAPLRSLSRCRRSTLPAASRISMLALVDAHRDLAVRRGRQRRVVGAVDLHQPGVVDGARALA